MVKKLLDTVPDRLYVLVAGIEQFYDVEEMLFEEALSRLKAFEERTRRHMQAGGDRADKQLMLTGAQWAARRRQQDGGGFDDHDDDGAASTTSGGGGKRRGRCYNCGQCEHFRRECPKPRKAQAAEQAFLPTATTSTTGSSRPWLRVCVLANKPRPGHVRCG